MTIIQTIILGIIEGITEFVPISSTFHLIFSAKILGIAENEFIKLFEVFIQSGAILAVVFVFGKRAIRDVDLLKKTFVAFLPTAVLGVILYKTIKNTFFESDYLMAGVFIFVGFLFLIFEWTAKKHNHKIEKGIEGLTYPQAFLIGILQALSFLPGFSRAGAIILSMAILGYRRADSAYFSFVLAVPTMLGAGFFDFIKTYSSFGISPDQYLQLSAGFIVSFIFAALTIKWFISYLQKHTLNIFGIYRIIAGTLIVLSLLILR